MNLSEAALPPIIQVLLGLAPSISAATSCGTQSRPLLSLSLKKARLPSACASYITQFRDGTQTSYHHSACSDTFPAKAGSLD